MTSLTKKPQEYIKEYTEEINNYNKVLQSSIDDKQTAVNWFNKQVNCIKSIKDSAGYKEIKHYFTRVLIADQDIIMDATLLGGDNFKEQAFTAAIEMKLATQFLNFLNNLETGVPISDDTTIEGE